MLESSTLDKLMINMAKYFLFYYVFRLPYSPFPHFSLLPCYMYNNDISPSKEYSIYPTENGQHPPPPQSSLSPSFQCHMQARWTFKKIPSFSFQGNSGLYKLLFEDDLCYSIFKNGLVRLMMVWYEIKMVWNG